ncbi:MAG: M43 family zinc metalloprotease [Bacteroidota bacterium]
MKTIQLSILLLALSCLGVQAQSNPHPHCQSHEVNEHMYHLHPESREEAESFNVFSRNFARTHSYTAAKGEAEPTYIIPVVFHVYGTSFSGSNVDDALITTALQKVNEDFRGLNDDYGTVSSLFAPIKATMDIEFRLAKIDPNGNTTTGIVYHAATNGFGNGSGYDAAIQADAWDNYKYANVYIQSDLYNDGSTTNSGVAWYPNTYMSDNDLARVVYNGRYLHGNTDKEFASILSHEFGHYLNLIHTFEGGCTYPNDEVADTPPEDQSVDGECAGATNCEGNPINSENYMGYNGASGCYKMFTAGQITRMEAAMNHPARVSLWQQSNLVATGVVTPTGPYLSATNTSATEDLSNTGIISTTSLITLGNGTFTQGSGSFAQGTHYSVSGLPSGLSVSVDVTSSTQLTLTLSGTATSHGNTQDGNVVVTLLNAAVSGGTSGLLSNPITYSLDFFDPWTVIYEDIADASADANSTWQYFTISTGDDYGAWMDNGDLRLETYTKEMIADGSRNITLLSAGTTINANSAWVTGGAYPDEHYIYRSGYTIWGGQEAYMGFKISIDNREHYGWFRMEVSSGGASMTIKDYAYSTQPFGAIQAGSTELGGNPPVANFSASAISITTGGSVSFTDQSSNSPTGWNWSFPGGSPASSTLQNPTVSYSTAGTYPVTLTTINAHGTDSETKPAYITVTDPTVSYCNSTGGGSYEYIAGVQVGNFSNTSGEAGYTDFTSQTISLDVGNSATLTLTPGFSSGAYTEYWSVYIDYNADGDFEDAGELVSSNLSGNSTVSGSFTVNQAASGSTRLRVTMKYGSFASSPCGDFGDGETEDYTVTFSSSTPQAPVAAFSANTTTINAGESIFFTDASTGNPTAWSWSFPGGTPATSTAQNPIVGFANPGTYTVNLTASNAQGTDTDSMVVTINAATGGGDAPTGYCSPTHGSPAGQYLTGVQLASGINNTSTHDGDGYSDYTNQSATLGIGGSYAITLTPHAQWAGTSVAAWIDWNRDGDFEDSNELVFTDNGANGQGSYSGTVVVPSAASLGNTRMRVRVLYNQAQAPCSDEWFGETEDYNILVISGAAGLSWNPKAKVYPNPNQGQFTVSLDLGDQSQTVTYTVVDALGREVYGVRKTGIGMSDIELSLDQVPSGLYILRVTTQYDVVLHQQKITIND